MAQREFERGAASRAAGRERRSDATGRAGATGRSPRAAPGSGDGGGPAGTPRHRGAVLLRLQRSHGNRFVQQVVTDGRTGPIIQPKLVVGPAGDRHEREADRVARQITSGQAVRAPGATGRAPVIQRLSGIDSGPVSAGVRQAVQAARGGGRSLPDGLRASMEQALGADFGGVRVHTDARADHLNRVLGARAFTTGQDLFFRRGEYDPSSAGGREVLAHELTHFVQQGSTGAAGGRGEVIQRMKIKLDGKDYDTESTTDLAAIKARLDQMTYKDAAIFLVTARRAAEKNGESVSGYTEIRQYVDSFKNTGYGPSYTPASSGGSHPTGIAIPTAAPAPAPGSPRPTGSVTTPSNPPPSVILPSVSAASHVAAATPPVNTVTPPVSTVIGSSNGPAGPATTLGSPQIVTNVGPPAAVIVDVVRGPAIGKYNLRDSTALKTLVGAISSDKTGPWLLGKYKDWFATAVHGVPNADSDFADVTKALADKTWEFDHPATARQLEEYKAFGNWSAYSHPMFGSTIMKRVQLWKLPDRAEENTKLNKLGYKLSMNISPQAVATDTERADAVVTHVVNVLHDVGAYGIDLQQVVKVNDNKNELYFLKIHIPPARSPVEVTVDDVRPDVAATGQVADLTKVDAELLSRLWPTQGAVTLQAYSEPLSGPEPLAIDSEQWRTDEIELLRDAIQFVPAAHWSLLSTLRFIRVKKLPKRRRGTSGASTATAEYYPTDPPVVCITDKVADPHFSEYFYDENSKKFLPQGARLIVHEVGHAVSMEKWRRAAVNYKPSEPASRTELDRMGGTGAMDAQPIKDIDKFIARNEFVTDYAAGQMGQSLRESARAELYAEAYSLWRTNPRYMQEKHKELAEWLAAQPS